MQGRASTTAARTRRPGAVARVPVPVPAALLVLLALLGLSSGCAHAPVPIRYDGSGRVPVTADGLYPVQTTRVGAAFVKPGASIAEYDRVMFDLVSISYAQDPRPHPRRTAAARRERRGFLLDADTLDRLKPIFQGAFERALPSSFAAASEAGPGVLRVSGRIVDLDVEVPVWRGSELQLVLDVGKMTLILDVRDSQTGAPLARIADRRAIRPQSGALVGAYQSNPVNNWGAIRELFAHWARVFRMGLDDLRALPTPPAPV